MPAGGLGGRWGGAPPRRRPPEGRRGGVQGGGETPRRRMDVAGGRPEGVGGRWVGGGRLRGVRGGSNMAFIRKVQGEGARARSGDGVDGGRQLRRDGGGDQGE